MILALPGTALGKQAEQGILGKQAEQGMLA